MGYGDYYEECQSMVDLSEEPLEAPPPKSAEKIGTKFSFDSGVITQHWVIRRKCQHPTLRRKAISSLIDNPCCKGLWDRVFAAGITQTVMELEEQHLTLGEHIPEWARIRYAIFTANLRGQYIALLFEQGDIVRRKMIDCSFPDAQRS